MIELLDDLFNWIGDLFDSGETMETIVDSGATVLDTAADGISTALLIQGVVYVASLTADSIREELRNRQEIKAKGVFGVVIKDYINHSGVTEIKLSAYNAQNQQVGTIQMQTKGYANVKKGDRIRI